MKFLYNISIHLRIFGMKIGSLFNEKLKTGILGRAESVAIVNQKFSKTDKIIWMHSASLGEYEQGVPVLENLKQKFPDHKILVTFFSPSGYENVVNKNNIADAICYLPFDLKNCVEEFTSQFNTEIFFTVKYEYWYNLLSSLKKNGVKIYVISALFYEKQVFFKLYGGFFRTELKENIDWFFHQTKESFDLAKSINLDRSTISGDTRFDRVKQFQTRDNFVEFINEFKQDKKLIILGSSWEAEENIAELVAKKAEILIIIIAPHDLKRIQTILNKFPEAILYSQFSYTQKLTHPKTQILIIDCIGILSKLYSYADLAVIGGGFHSAGLHNILEAAVYGVPVIFGNQYRKNPEADALIDANGGKCFDDFVAASVFIREVIKKDIENEGEEKSFLKQMSENAYNFVNSQPDATAIIVKKILESNI